MSSTLAKQPLRTSLSMLSGHDSTVPLPVDHPSQPIGYLYARWNVATGEEIDDDLGYYDEEAQVWVTPTGDITMGIYTKTSTGGACGGNSDCVTDDACA